MSGRLVLWGAFTLVHLGVAILGWYLPNQPMGDVYLVYEPWSHQALTGGGVVGITEPWVYPQLALVPVILAHLFTWLGGYVVAWAVMVTAIDAAAFAMLIGTARSAGRVQAAWFWLASIALLGPVGLYRLDGVTVPLALVGCLGLAGRPWWGSVLLAAATWIKVWPAALIAAAVVAVRRRVAVLGGAAAASAVVIAVILGAGGWRYLWGFLGEQTGRGLQLEAPVSAFYLWRAVAGLAGSSIYYDPEILTFQVTGPEVDIVIAVMTPLLVAAVAAVAAIGAVKAWRGAGYAVLFPPLALALVTALIVLNKVGSPQYMTWLVVPVIVGLVLQRRRWWGPAALVLVIGAVTQAVYPIVYGGLLQAQALPAALLTLRNVLVVALAVWAVARLVRVPVPARVATAVAARTTAR